MSALAQVALEMGCQVTGSDLQATEVTQRLERQGAQIFIGHDERHIVGSHAVVYSTAAAATCEVEAARRQGVPTLHRAEVLAQLLNQREGVAVAGAHGKTTVTSMIAWTLVGSGRRPGYVIGADVPTLGNGRWGEDPPLVAEADESDRSFLLYHPKWAVVTSIEPDHLEHYAGDFANMVAAFAQFLAQVRPGGAAILGIDDPEVAGLSSSVSVRTITYGLERGHYQAKAVVLSGSRTCFTVTRDGRALVDVELQVPGRHNVRNALAALAVCSELGVPLAQAAAALAQFRGARRRFEVVAEVHGILVVDDYAHHPTELRATIRAAREGWPGRRIVAVFQPHRYTRTHFLMADFAGAFGEADVVYITEVYAPPPEIPIAGATGERLAALIAQRERRPVTFCPDLPSLVERLSDEVRPGDIVLTMGAGNIWKAARLLAERLGTDSLSRG